MHLSAGVIKFTTILIHDWAQKMGNNKLLYCHMNGCINMFSTYCCIDSYRLVSYADNYKFPGWIADMCCTWNKLMPWLYSCIRMKDFSFISYIPVGDMKKWNKDECLKFCKTRKIYIDKDLSVGSLWKEIIKIYKDNNNKLPTHKK